MDAIEQRIAQMAYDDHTVDNACLNDSAQCDAVWLLRRLLPTNTLTPCYVEDCAFKGVYLAQIRRNVIFVTFSTFAFGIEDLNLSSHIDLALFLRWPQLKESQSYTARTQYFIGHLLSRQHVHLHAA